MTARGGIDERWPPPHETRDVSLAGFVDDFPDVGAERAVFSFRVVGAGDARVPARLRLSWYDPPPTLAAGESLDIVARLRAPRGLVNPGTFDYERWLFVERIGATGYVRSGSIVTDRRYGIAQDWLRFRARLARRIDQAIDNPSAAALVVALSLGERDGFDDDQWAVLRRTGTSHLVAISGLHVGLIAAFAFWLLHRLGLMLPYRFARHSLSAAAVLAIVPAGLYAALAGFALPTQRALAMLVIVQALIVSRRRPALGSSLALALIGVLGLDPLASLEASFWLSFGAVAMIALLVRSAPTRTEGTGRVRRMAAGFLRLQTGITLGLVPLTVLFFNEASLVSIGVNLVAIPFFSFVMVPLCLVTTLAIFCGVGSGIVTVCATLADLVWTVLGNVGAWPYASVPLQAPGLLAMVGAVGGVLLALPRQPLPGRRAAWLALLPLVFARDVRPDPGAADLQVFDVGHGLAVLVETENHRLLYDAGPAYLSGFDTGAQVIVPSLRSAGAATLDLLLLSHADIDHAGGAAAVLDAFPAARRLHGPDVSDIGGRTCVAGEHWTWDRVVFTVLHPPPDFTPLGNESSCVLRIDTAHASVLIAGDIEARAELLLADREAVGADIVVVPHHGSATSSTERFVRAVKPRLAIVSAGFDNRWGFPRPEVTRRWERVGASMLVTGDVGAIGLRLRAGDWDVRLERRAKRHYWRAETPLSPSTGDGGAL